MPLYLFQDTIQNTIQDTGHLVAGADPQAMAALSPGWAEDVERFGPWTATDVDLPGLGRSAVHLSENWEGPDVFLAHRAASGLDLLWALDSGASETGALPPFTACLTGVQTQGRGRLRRPWSSRPGNLHLCFTLPAPKDKDWDRVLPLVLGDILAGLLERACGRPLAVKWPNDLVLDGRKVAGLLLEERGGRLVLGLGVNLVWAPEEAELRQDHVLPAGILPLGRFWQVGGPKPLSLWARLVNQLVFEYDSLLEYGSLEAFISRISKRLLWLGRTVTHTDGTRETKSATLAGLSTDGGLRLVDAHGDERIVHSGSVGPG